MSHQIVAGNTPERAFVADDRVTERVNAESGSPKELVEYASGIVTCHCHFAEDDVTLLFPFLGRKVGVHHCVGEDIEGGDPVPAGNRGVKNRTVLGGVGVDIASGVVDLAGYCSRGPCRGSLEDHVFDGM